MKIHIQYFAVLREQRGLSSESVDTSATTPAALYCELAAAHRFSLDPTLVRVAVNGEFVPMESALSDGDAVVFIPPVAGG